MNIKLKKKNPYAFLTAITASFFMIACDQSTITVPNDAGNRDTGTSDTQGADAPGNSWTPGPGNLTVMLTAEDAVNEGLEKDILDGWEVSFDKYIVVVSGLSIKRENSTDHLERNQGLVIDLKAIPENGLEFARFENIQTGVWNQVGYAFGVSPGTSRQTLVKHSSVSDADYARVVGSNGIDVLVKGHIHKSNGQSCPGGSCRAAGHIDFEFATAASVLFSGCEAEEGAVGVTVAGSGTTSVAITIHVDHLFFNGFPEGEEATVKRYAQWIANADLNADNRVDIAELAMISQGQFNTLLVPNPEYDLSSPPIVLNNAADYAKAQLMTQGHFQGEGECAFEAR